MREEVTLGRQNATTLLAPERDRFWVLLRHFRIRFDQFHEVVAEYFDLLNFVGGQSKSVHFVLFIVLVNFETHPVEEPELLNETLIWLDQDTLRLDPFERFVVPQAVLFHHKCEHDCGTA